MSKRHRLDLGDDYSSQKRSSSDGYVDGDGSVCLFVVVVVVVVAPGGPPRRYASLA